MKELLYRLQPVQIYIVLALSIVYFLMQLFLSHITHALTLLVDSYHMLCNIVALSGCIITIKVRFCFSISLFIAYSCALFCSTTDNQLLTEYKRRRVILAAILISPVAYPITALQRSQQPKQWSK